MNSTEHKTLIHVQLHKGTTIDKSPRRYRNVRYQSYILTELRRRAINKGLNVNNLSTRREFVKALMADRVRNSAIFIPHPNRLSFLDLPGEIRNRIYGMVVATRENIKVTRGRQRFEFWVNTPWKSFDQYNKIGRKQVVVLHTDIGLAKLSMLNYTIRREARTFFFDENTFTLRLQYRRSFDDDHCKSIRSRALKQFREALGDDFALMSFDYVWMRYSTLGGILMELLEDWRRS
jgi:hypothetical protein